MIVKMAARMMLMTAQPCSLSVGLIVLHHVVIKQNLANERGVVEHTTGSTAELVLSAVAAEARC